MYYNQASIIDHLNNRPHAIIDHCWAATSIHFHQTPFRSLKGKGLHKCESTIQVPLYSWTLQERAAAGKRPSLFTWPAVRGPSEHCNRCGGQEPLPHPRRATLTARATLNTASTAHSFVLPRNTGANNAARGRWLLRYTWQPGARGSLVHVTQGYTSHTCNTGTCGTHSTQVHVPHETRGQVAEPYTR